MTDPVQLAIKRLFEAAYRTAFIPQEIGAALGELRSALRLESGSDLAKRRTDAELSQAAVARAWITRDHPEGVSKAYLGRVERQIIPTPATRAAYLTALTKATEGDQ